MMSHVRLFALTALVSLSACGFQPMYGGSNAVQSGRADGGAVTLDQVEIANIKDESGVYLRNALLDRFYTNGYPAAPKYRLILDDISEVRTKLDITSNSEATRAQLSQRTNLTLINRDTGKPVLNRDLTSISSFNILESEYATRASEQSARQSALSDLARQAELQVSLFLNRAATSAK